MLLISVLACFLIWKRGNDRNRELQGQLAEMQVMEKRSAVVKGVSKRMEEIAFQQKLVSDEQREQAIEQARIAEEMTRLSELERERAVKAEQTALASERTAREAYQNAEHQRQLADQQRIQAEYSKRVADTLSYITIGRSLGLRALSLYQAGEKELAALLTYAAYRFTCDYGDSPYRASVYDPLVLVSQNTLEKSMKNGPITGVELMPGTKGRVITVSMLGEIYQHEIIGKSISSKCLFGDGRYRFKDLYLNSDGTIYAVSRTGHLVVVKDGVPSVIPIPGDGSPAWLAGMAGDKLLIVGSGCLALFDMKSGTMAGMRPIDFQVTGVSRLKGSPILFDAKGRQHVINSLQQIATSKSPVHGTVTAFAYSNRTGISAYGTSEGVIYCMTTGGQIRELVGHSSKITKIKMNGDRLYSSCLDGAVDLWQLSENNPEPLVLIRSRQWIQDFTLDQSREHIWATTANGSLIEHTISADQMAAELKKRLKRNLTVEEWNYYVGSNIPYRKLL